MLQSRTEVPLQPPPRKASFACMETVWVVLPSSSTVSVTWGWNISSQVACFKGIGSPMRSKSIGGPLRGCVLTAAVVHLAETCIEA